jgi:hypothetical protein
MASPCSPGRRDGDSADADGEDDEEGKDPTAHDHHLFGEVIRLATRANASTFSVVVCRCPRQGRSTRVSPATHNTAS